MQKSIQRETVTTVKCSKWGTQSETVTTVKYCSKNCQFSGTVSDGLGRSQTISVFSLGIVRNGNYGFILCAFLSGKTKMT